MPTCLKPIKRPQPHAAGDQLLHTFTGQVLHRRHASALLMRHVGHHLHVSNGCRPATPTRV
jgi:hypothetical protein